MRTWHFVGNGGSIKDVTSKWLMWDKSFMSKVDGF
jgi:hypothetical protein